MKKRLCVACRWFELRVDFDARSHYGCALNGETLTASILRRKACRYFAPSPPAPHWGA